MLALLKRFWTDHRLATVISLALLFLGLLIKPWTLVLVLVVAFGGPLVGRLESLALSPVGSWRRSHWIGLALVLSAVLLALTGSSGGQGALTLALLPVAWVLVTDRSLLQGSKKDEREIQRGLVTLPRAEDETGSSAQAKVRLESGAANTKRPERLIGGELLAKMKELGDVGKSDLVRACGYFSQKPDGSERLNFTEFYEALLQAKGIGGLESGTEEDKPGTETELDTRQSESYTPNGRREELVGFIVDNQSQPSDWLALKLGYKTTEGKADLYRFFNELMLSLGFPEELDSSINEGEGMIDFIHENEGGSSPILNKNEITGCYRVRMSCEARIHDWEEEDWSEVQEQTGEEGLDGPYEVHESNSYELRCATEDNFLDACNRFEGLGGKFHDLLRVGYKYLGDDAYGMIINEYLEENEEHPFYYVELAQKLGLIADKKVISNKGAIDNSDANAHQDASEESDGIDKLIGKRIFKGSDANAWGRAANDNTYLEIDLLNTELYFGGSDPDVYFESWIDQGSIACVDVSNDGKVLTLSPSLQDNKRGADKAELLSKDVARIKPVDIDEDCIKYRISMADAKAIGYQVPSIPKIGCEMEILRWVDGSWIAQFNPAGTKPYLGRSDFSNQLEDAPARSNTTYQNTNGIKESALNVNLIRSSSGPFSLNIVKSEISEPDEDGDISLNLGLALASEAAKEVELVISKLIVLNCKGLPLLEREDEHETHITYDSPDVIELESGYFKEHLLGSSSTSDTQVLVQLNPCGCQFTELPFIAVPLAGNMSGIAEALQILPDVSLQGLSIFTAQPDNDGECNLEFKGLIVNESSKFINKLEVSICLADRNGREIETTDWSDKIAPHGTIGLDQSLWGIKSSKLTEAKATLRVKAFYSLANYEMSWPVGNPSAHSIQSTKDSSGEQSAKQQETASPAQSGDRAIDIATNSTRQQDVEAFAVEIKNATYIPPDEDGDTRYEVEYSLTNRSKSPIELLLSRLFVLHPSGLLVATTEDETEDMADVGESINATISTWGTPSTELDGDPGSAQLLLQISACSCIYEDLGSVDCPEQGGYITLKPESTTNSGLQVEAITVSTDPPDDGESRINIKALIRNNSDSAIPKLALQTKLISASGRELEETSSQEEVEANGTVLIEDSFWGIKEGRLTSSRMQFALKAFSALGTSKTLATNLSVEN